MSKKNNQGKIGKTNFLINFSNQEDGNHNFDPSNHHYHNIFRKVLITIIAIIVIYFIGFGIYAVHHHMSSESNRQTHVTRVTHYKRKSIKEKQPKAKTKINKSKKDKVNNLKRTNNRENSKYNPSTKSQLNRVQNNTTRTNETPAKSSTVNNQIHR